MLTLAERSNLLLQDCQELSSTRDEARSQEPAQPIQLHICLHPAYGSAEPGSHDASSQAAYRGDQSSEDQICRLHAELTSLKARNQCVTADLLCEQTKHRSLTTSLTERDQQLAELLDTVHDLQQQAAELVASASDHDLLLRQCLEAAASQQSVDQRVCACSLVLSCAVKLLFISPQHSQNVVGMVARSSL